MKTNKQMEEENHKSVKEYIYLDDNGEIMYTSRNKPMEYEDQTDCIKIECSNSYDLDRYCFRHEIEKIFETSKLEKIHDIEKCDFNILNIDILFLKGSKVSIEFNILSI